MLDFYGRFCLVKRCNLLNGVPFVYVFLLFLFYIFLYFFILMAWIEKKTEKPVNWSSWLCYSFKTFSHAQSQWNVLVWRIVVHPLDFSERF